MPDDPFKRWVDDLQQNQPVHLDQTRQTIAAALRPKRSKWPWVLSVAVVAVICFAVSAATLQPVQEVLAKVPIIGWWFESTEAKIVAKAGKLQGVNLTQTDQGMTVTLKSAYVQGKTVAISGKIIGFDPNDTHSDPDRRLKYHLATKNSHIHMSESSWASQKDGTYHFSVVGTVDHLSAGKQLDLPLVFTEILGVQVNLRFNLQLTASAATKVAVKGHTQVAGYQLKVLSAENYDGGTGLLALQVTQPVAPSDYRLVISALHVNGGKQEYLLQRVGGSAQVKPTQIYRYRVKALPKKITTLSFDLEVQDWAKPKTYPLSALPAELSQPDRKYHYQFSPATLKANQLAFNFSLTGVATADRTLQNDDLPFMMYLRLADAKAWQTLGEKYNAQGIGINRIAPLLFWLENPHQFKAGIDLSQTPFKDKTLAELELVVPTAFEKSRSLPTATIQND